MKQSDRCFEDVGCTVLCNDCTPLYLNCDGCNKQIFNPYAVECDTEEGEGGWFYCPACWAERERLEQIELKLDQYDQYGVYELDEVDETELNSYQIDAIYMLRRNRAKLQAEAAVLREKFIAQPSAS